MLSVCASAGRPRVVHSALVCCCPIGHVGSVQSGLPVSSKGCPSNTPPLKCMPMADSRLLVLEASDRDAKDEL